MNTPLYIAKRIIFKGDKSKQLSNPIVNVAIGGITLGIVVIILSVAIVTGFKKEIREKVIGFGSHVQINNYDSNNSLEEYPISKSESFYNYLDTVKGVRNIQVYAHKLGLIKTKTENKEILIKGIDSDFNWDFFKNNLVEGETFSVSDTGLSKKILISKHVSNKLQVNINDKLRVFFIVNINGKTIARPRVFYVSGIYETGLEEYDEKIALADIKHIKKLNDWKSDHIGGIEILIDNFDDIDEMGEKIFSIAGNKIFDDGSKLNVKTIREVKPEIFTWLDLLDKNVQIILGIIIIVASLSMISTLLIIILERINMIGILKALGSTNYNIQSIFIYNAMYLIGKGMFWGNTIGLILCFIQYKFNIIKLSQESYYVDVVPINFSWLYFIMINIGTFIICSMMIIIPTIIVSRISPVKAIRYK